MNFLKYQKIPPLMAAARTENPFSPLPLFVKASQQLDAPVSFVYVDFVIFQRISFICCNFEL